MNLLLAVLLLTFSQVAQETSQESSSENPATSDAATGEQKPAPKYIKPRRGPAPRIEDLTSVEYEMNSDGTIRRRVVVVAGQVHEGLSEPEPKKPYVDPDPNYKPPEHSKIGPSDNATLAVAESPPDRSVSGPLLLISIVGGLIAISFAIGYFGTSLSARAVVSQSSDQTNKQ
jgi:hypothetical protein